jgi:hypothetical protein
MLFETHRPKGDETVGKPFWVPQTGMDQQSLPADGAWCEKCNGRYPKCYPTYNFIGYDGVVARCDTKPSKRTVKDKTGHITVKKYPGLKVLRQLGRDSNTGIKVKNDHGKIFHLIKLAEKELGGVTVEITSESKSESKKAKTMGTRTNSTMKQGNIASFFRVKD